MNRYALLSLLVLLVGGCESAPSSKPAETTEDTNRRRRADQLEKDLARGPRRGTEQGSEIASDNAADAKEYALEIYDVTDLVSPHPSLTLPGKQHDAIKPEEVEATIKQKTGGEAAWQEPASCELHRGQMIVHQTRAIHRKIMETLRALRRSRS